MAQSQRAIERPVTAEPARVISVLIWTDMPVTCERIGSNVRSHRYRIIVCGRLGKITREAFEDLSVEYHGANTGLTGELDQAALYGVLNRILAFGLELVALSRLDDEPQRSPGELARSVGLEPSPSEP